MQTLLWFPRSRHFATSAKFYCQLANADAQPLVLLTGLQYPPTVVEHPSLYLRPVIMPAPECRLAV